MNNPRIKITATVVALTALLLTGCGTSHSNGALSSSTTSSSTSVPPSTTSSVVSPGAGASTTTTTAAPKIGPYTSVAAAEKLLDTKGDAGTKKYDPDSGSYDEADTTFWNPTATLHALESHGIPCMACSGDYQLFFFANGNYLGTDTTDPSNGNIQFVSENKDTISVSYLLFNPSDGVCCPSAGEKTVRFQLQGTKLVPLDAIPPPAQFTGTSVGR